MSDVLTKLRSYRKVLDERAPEIQLAEITTPLVAPTSERRGSWRVVAASLAALLIVGILLILNLNDEVPPADSVVPTTMVDVTPTTVVSPTTAPTTQGVDSAAGEFVVGDDEIVVAMAQKSPLNSDPESLGAEGPDPASGRTAGTGFHWSSDASEGPGTVEPVNWFGLDFLAFDSEQLASEFVNERLIQDPGNPELILETYIFDDLGEEATGNFVFNRGRGGGSGAYVTVRQGRFVAQAFGATELGLDSDTVDAFDAANNPLVVESVKSLTAIAASADETMQTVLASNVQPLATPAPETLTTYEMHIFVYDDDPGAEVLSIVTPEGYGCEYGDLVDGPQLGVAELGGAAFQRIDWTEGWFSSTLDSPAFQSGKGLCQTWSPHLEESYLRELITLKEGHVGFDEGRLTNSYWFTKEDLIAAGVLKLSDNVTIDGHMIVDQAGPWLVHLSVSLEGDTEAISKVIRLEVPDLETASLFTIDIDYGTIDGGRRTWADRLQEMIQPRP